MCKVRARKWRGAHAGWMLCVRTRIISHYSAGWDGDGGRGSGESGGVGGWLRAKETVAMVRAETRRGW